MTYTTDDVRTAAVRIAEKTPEKRELFELMCRSAAEELERRLLRTPDTKLFVTAAAMLALALYAESEGDADVKSFRAGSISVERGGMNSAAAMRNTAMRLLAGYIPDGDFAFVGVRG